VPLTKKNRTIMTLQEAANFFESLKNQTTKKSEIKIYKEFLHILAQLKTREFSNEEIKSIETELDRLNLESDLTNNKKHFNKILQAFKDYLKTRHSLITVGYYANIGVSMGAAFGVVAGVVFGERLVRSSGLAMGISIGMLIGLLIGRSMDSKALNEGKVL